MNYGLTAAIILASYLLGAIPFGLLVGLTKGVDIRKFGSGSTGATNALRTVGWKASLFVFLLDALKAVSPVLAARWLLADPTIEAVCGLAAVVGHNWPVYIGWRGGKGVSSSLGAMAILMPLPTLIGGLLGVSLIAWSRYVSLGSVTGAVVVPLTSVVYASYVAPLPVSQIAVCFALAIMIIIQHRSNIQRLLAGNERKLGQRTVRPELLRREGES